MFLGEGGEAQSEGPMDQKLLDYIEQARTAGQSDEKIQNTLRGSGWPEAIIVQAFSGVAPSDRPSAPPTPGTGVVKKGPNLFLTIAFVVGGLILLGGVFIFFTIQGSLGTARERGRDARRVGDLASLTAALELYYDTHDQYPPGEGYLSDGAIDALVQERLLRAMPADPMGLTSYFYCASSDTQSYVLGAQLEYERASYLERDVDGDQHCGLGTGACDDPVYCIGNEAPPPTTRNLIPSEPSALPPSSTLVTVKRFGRLASVTTSSLNIRQTSGYSMTYTVDANTQYFECDQPASFDVLARDQSIVIAQTGGPDRTRRAVSVYVNESCGAETLPGMLAREEHDSDFGSPYRKIVSGTVKRAGVSFEVMEESDVSQSFSYGIDTVFYQCGVPREFSLAKGQNVSVSFVPAIEKKYGATYVGAVDLRDDC